MVMAERDKTDEQLRDRAREILTKLDDRYGFADKETLGTLEFGVDDIAEILQSILAEARQQGMRDAAKYLRSIRPSWKMSLEQIATDLDRGIGSKPPDVPAGVAQDGSRFLQVGPVTIGCMSAEARDLLDTAMDKWREHLKVLPMPPHDPVYAFAYWLFRWSGLVNGQLKT